MSRNITFEDFAIDLRAATAGSVATQTFKTVPDFNLSNSICGILASSVTSVMGIGQTSGALHIENVATLGGEYGFRINSEDGGAWQFETITLERCVGIAAKRWLSVNTNNSSINIHNPYVLFPYGGTGYHIEKCGMFTSSGIGNFGTLINLMGGDVFDEDGNPNPLWGGCTGVHVKGDHLAILLQNIQTENIAYDLLNEASIYHSPIIFDGGLLQARLQLDASCVLHLRGTRTPAGAVRDKDGVAAFLYADTPFHFAQTFTGFPYVSTLEGDDIHYLSARHDKFTGFSLAVYPPLPGSFTFDPGAIAANTETSFAIDYIGAQYGDLVTVFPPENLTAGLSIERVFASATDEITIALRNETGGSLDAPSGVWKSLKQRI